MGKGELRDPGRERKKGRQIQTGCYLYTVWRCREPYDNVIISGDRLRQEYNPDAIQWSMSGEGPEGRNKSQKRRDTAR